LKRLGNDGLSLVIAGAVIFFVVGVAWGRITPIAMGDFKVVYYSARCLLHNGDPYSGSEVTKVYNAEGRELPSMSERSREVITRFFYPPTAFIVTVPFALLGFGVGHVLWMTLSGGGLILAAVLVWDLSRDLAPFVSGALLGFLLMNSFWLFMIGNSAAIVVSFCVVAVWCFMRERFVPVGILLLALSLALKPHDSGLVWLFFLLAGGAFRKQALQTLAVLAVLSLPAYLWVMKVSPHWIQETQANAATFSEVGGITDPGVAGMAGRNMDSIVELQSVVSVLWENPRIYNLITYLIFAVLLLVWVLATLYLRPRGARAWIALAAIAPLSMLPVYHLQHDAKLIMLAIPGCALLWAEGGMLGWIALLITGACIGINGDIFTGIRIAFTHQFVMPQPNLAGKITTVMLTRPGPIALLVMSMFYLWMYMRRGLEESPAFNVPSKAARVRETATIREIPG
jgi:Glycosyltransferase family 87